MSNTALMRILPPFTFLLCLLFSIKVSSQVSCNNWLRIPNSQSYVTVGEIDIPGTQITVEGLFSRDSALTPEGFTSLNVVSKHWTPNDVNYLLRVDRAQVTTTNGHFMTPDICELKNKKIYHVAMTYDGATLKFYQNGFLMSQLPVTGDLVLNDYLTTIAATANSPTTNTQLIGYLNEIRIWNVVRSQAELQQYMNSSLPNPTAQTGLLGYYTFESLNNKQGNALYNATLHGNAAINAAIPDCNFIVDSCQIVVTSACNNWLRIPNSQSYVTVGEIDIPGTQITIEGLFSRDSALTPEGFSSLNVVSKHWTPNDVNYLLRVDRAQITTTNGHFMTPDICELKNKKIYHAAMTYDGAILKFYQNGFLMSQLPVTGNMVLNDYLTTIAATANSPTTNTQLIGYLNEIRIWNVVRSQAELQQYMNSALPNPTTQTGLLGYYTFESLSNKQGNALYNATLHGNATINAAIPDCNFIADSCLIITGNEAPDTINTYAGVLSIDICTNTIIADDVSTFNAGDTVVIMQMKGVSIDSSNTINFGSITNHNNAGKYEFNYVKNITGNSIEFQHSFLNNYDAVKGRVQLIRVPYFSTLTVNSTLTCPEWNGTKGGVLIINSAAEVNLNASIDVSNKGFSGGSVGAGFSCGNTDLWAIAAPAGGKKGEGIADYIPGLEAGGGRLATGGGGAYAANSGGGGGGNFGAGGFGGSHSNTCATTTQSMQGEAGDYSQGNRVFAGGGGGGGQQDDGQPVAAGGRGGGIVIIKAFTLNSNSQGIIANGESIATLVRDEGGAGGGAGGSVVLFVNGFSGNLFMEANGGEGSSNNNFIYPSRCHGPGGGGGGGFIGSSLTVLPPFVTASVNGGIAGVILNPASACFNSNYNASDGEPGGTTFNLTIPEATVPFVKNIDSVRINDSVISCTSFDFKGIAYINNNPIEKWEWSFGDGESATIQNTSHTYSSYGTRMVKLVITDINGCQDSITKLVSTSGIQFDFVHEQDACDPLSVQFRAVGDTTPEIYWSLGDGTFINNIRNPLHQFADTGWYLVQYSTGNSTTGCIDTIQKLIFIGYRHSNIILTPDTTICFGTGKILRADLDTSLQFCWSPLLYLELTDPANPVTTTPGDITYTLFAASEENNLIVNGDFSAGDNGFSTGYVPGSAPLPASGYLVGTYSFNAGPATASCSDHTTGAGNMLMARNNSLTNDTVWLQTVTVVPNTTYRFSTYVQSLQSSANIELQLAINGIAVVENISPAVACAWQQHSALWNSGNNSSVVLSIQNKANNSGIDDYFAIDDIKFLPWSIEKDTVNISVDTPFVVTRADTSICESATVILNTSGASAYSWSPAAGLSNAATQNPVAAPGSTTEYFVTGTSAFGCTATDSVTISVKAKPIITNTGDTTICRSASVNLFATGGASYSWEPAALLNNSAIANPVASPATNNTKYVVTVTGANNCIAKDSFVVAVKALPVFSVSGEQSVCLNDNAQLTATGGNYYEWSPASLVSDPGISNPTTVTAVNTNYTVLIKDTTCNYDTILNTKIIVLPLPAVTASKSNNVSCADKTAQLEATGAQAYSWLPVTNLTNPLSASPVASPAVTTLYTVTGTNSNGCTNTDTVTIVADFSDRSLFLLPNAFSPNGNGRNDCFGLKYFGAVTQLRFIIYNRFGEVVFATSNPAACWDGTYRGKPCEPGNFVYYVKANSNCGNVEKKGNVVLIR